MLNHEKCKCIILPENYPCDLSFSISDVQVPIVDHLELLGVTIDNSLNFSKHTGMQDYKESWKSVRCFEQAKEHAINRFEDVPLQLVCNVLFYLLFCDRA